MWPIPDVVVLYGGLALAGVSALGLLVGLVVLQGRARLLGRQLDEEYGPRAPHARKTRGGRRAAR